MQYQPQIDFKQMKITGAEALIRWKHPVIGMVPPVLFIPDAEKSMQILSLEKWVFKTCLQQKTTWENIGMEKVELAINLSNATLNSEETFEEIEQIIAGCDLDFETVTVEITETTMIKNVEVAKKNLERLKRYGIKIALDDFGTGFSSLSHIKDFPIDIIKIDRSFIQDIHENDRNALIVKNIIMMSHDLNFKVVAEGIEHIKQTELLADMGCDLGQGFLFAKPMHVNEIEKKLLTNSYKLHTIQLRTSKKKNEFDLGGF